MKLIKTKQANKLLCEAVGSQLLAKQAISGDGACYKFNSSKSIVDDVIEGHCWQRYANNILIIIIIHLYGTVCRASETPRFFF